MSRYSTVLRVLTFVLIAAIVAVSGLLVRFLIVNAGNDTPRSELERAVFAAEEAVRANPEDPAARVKLASAYLEQGAVRAAREQADIAARLNPDDPTVHYIKGLTESRSGDHAKAIQSLTKATKMKGQIAAFYQDVYTALSKEYESEGQIAKAIEALDNALNFGPENVVLLYERGQLYERAKKPADAYYDYVQVLSYVPDHPEAREAMVRLAEDDPKVVEEARKKFELETSSTPAAQ